MKNILIAIIFVVVMPFNSCVGVPAKSQNDSENKISDVKSVKDINRILVRFKPGTDAETIKNIQNKLGLESVKAMNTKGLYLMKVIYDVPVNTVLKKLNEFNDVLYAEPDYKYRVNE